MIVDAEAKFAGIRKQGNLQNERYSFRISATPSGVCCPVQEGSMMHKLGGKKLHVQGM